MDERFDAVDCYEAVAELVVHELAILFDWESATMADSNAAKWLAVEIAAKMKEFSDEQENFVEIWTSKFTSICTKGKTIGGW